MRGKGTQAEILSAKLGIPTISTGNILRAAIKDGTPIGLQAKSYMDAGKLVPDEVIIGIVAGAAGSSPTAQAAIILDGVPRTIAQAEALDAGTASRFDHVLSIEISDAAIEERMDGTPSLLHLRRTLPHVTPSPPKQEGICDMLRRRTDAAR